MGTTTDWGIQLQRSSADLHGLLSAGLPERGQDLWLDALEAELRRLSAALVGFGEQIDGGLYNDVIEEAPRLASGVRKLREQQSWLCEALRGQLLQLHGPDCCAERLRHQLVSFVHMLDAHNHHAVGLVYDAYDVDLGGQG